MKPSAFALTNPGKLRLYSTAELLRLPPPEWLIHGIMPAGGLVGLYGQPGIGKSFLALDFAMCVAAGEPWHERKVKKGPVLYIAAEGGTGMGKRARAWTIDHDTKAKKITVMWLLEPIPIYGDSNDVDRVMEKIVDEVQVHPRLVVIDTLARCFDGNENEQEDMGRFVAGADRFRQEFDAAVIVVHHTRLDGDRERGNTAFRGAADTMLSVQERQGRLWLACNKQKDAEEFEEIELILHPVPEVESCVIWPARSARVQAKTDVVVEILRANQRLTFSQWAQAAKKLKVPGSTFKRRIVALKENGEIVKENGTYRLTKDHKKKKK
jgi:KaiC/GvpD/RAD55 family RecA-like ATPase